jgi:hypothetical protein
MNASIGFPPRVIWTLWLQGWDNAPAIVRACLARWQNLNPGWRVHALDAQTLARFLSASDIDRIIRAETPLEAISDQIRIELLHHYGGVWADATTMCMRPLDRWLPASMPMGFSRFQGPRLIEWLRAGFWLRKKAILSSSVGARRSLNIGQGGANQMTISGSTSSLRTAMSQTLASSMNGMAQLRCPLRTTDTSRRMIPDSPMSPRPIKSRCWMPLRRPSSNSRTSSGQQIQTRFWIG